jgi:hypothetical protein
MLKRHEDILMTRIDEVTTLGWSVIHWREAYLWYNADRLGKRFYRDLRNRFQEENEGELHIYVGKEALVLIHNDGLMSVSEKLGEEAEE